MDMYVVVKSINDFSFVMDAFPTLEKAKEHFREMLTEEFAKANTTVDDNGDDIDYCVVWGECLLDDHYHHIDVCKYHG